MTRLRHFVFPLVLLLAAGACTPMIYGVPQETWETMGEAERIEAMRAYEQRRIAYQEAQAEKARIRAIELENQRAREAEEARQRQVRVEAIYRGRGQYGDLLGVTLEKGKARIGGKHRGFEPVHFKIARGEIKTISLVSGTGRTADLTVAYLDGTLFLDHYPSGTRVKGHRLPYDPGWGAGVSYAGISSKGPLLLRDAEAHVEILGRRGRPTRDQSTPPVIVVQQPPSPQVIVVERDAPPPPPQVVVIHDSPPAARPDPQVVVIDRGGRRHSETDGRPEDGARGRPNRDDPGRPEEPRDAPAIERPESGPDRVRVIIRGGTLKAKGTYQAFEPITLDLHEGESRRVRVLTRTKAPALLLVAYRDGVLYLDGKPGRGSGGGKPTAIRYDPAWTQGKHYRLTTHGELKLRNVTVVVEMVGA